MDFFNRLFGTNVSPVVSFIMVFVVALVVIGMAFWLFSFIRSRGLGMGIGLGSRGRQPRLAVLDYTDVDNRRRLVLIRRDNVEHLLLIGGSTEIVVEQNIIRGLPVTNLRDPMPYREAADEPAPPAPVDLSEPTSEQDVKLSPRDQARRAAGQLRPAPAVKPADPFFETPTSAPDIRVHDEPQPAAAPAPVIAPPRPVQPPPMREPVIPLRYEAPKVEAAKIEPQRAEPVRAEPMRVEPPRIETPKPEAPKVEAPKIEPAKVEHTRPQPAPEQPPQVQAPQIHVSQPEPPKTVEPAATEAPAKPGPSGDTLAQRLEQAMRRPLSRPAPLARPEPAKAQPKAAEPATPRPVTTPVAPATEEAVKPSPLTQHEKMVFDSLEEEMASLLGRAPKKSD